MRIDPRRRERPGYKTHRLEPILQMTYGEENPEYYGEAGEIT